MTNSNGLMDTLAQFKQQFTEDSKRLHKCYDLIQKLVAREFTIAFCGHFSAGKSTMINELISEKVLPSNPIPTSANVVKLMTGTPGVKVGFKDGTSTTLQYPYDMNEIQKYCTDGDEVDYVEISSPNDQLPKGVSILDTPGIDSSEDAHRVSAESRLHVADLIIYMVDYNHVQSKVNFEFVKELKNKEKEVIFVIHQIDKHLDSELSFQEYRSRIETSFTEHDVQVDGLFFTTVKEETHSDNELNLLKLTLAQQLEHRNSSVIRNVIKESHILIDEHINWKEESQQQEINRLKSAMAPFKNSKDLYKELLILKEQKKNLSGYAQEFGEECMNRVETLLENANLMPYHTREYGREFLESKQIGFKMGGLLSKRKTKAEKQSRMQNFHHAVKDNAQMHIDIHLKKLFFDILKRYEVDDEALYDKVHHFTVNISEELLTRTINRGALLNSQSVLQYCAQLKKEIVGMYKRKALSLVSEIKEHLEQDIGQRKLQMTEDIDKYERKQKVAERLDRIVSSFEALKDEMKKALNVDQEEINVAEEEVKLPSFQSKKKPFQEKTPKVNIGKVSDNIERVHEDMGKIDIERTIKQLRKASETLEGIPGFTSTLHELKRRVDNLQHQSFTIALFGAFSAGKSSFANALLGEDILPVSPNPTTAAINKILPPDKSHSHGTVEVFFKSEEDLLNEVNESLQVSGKKIEQLSDLEDLLHEHDQIQTEFELEMKKEKLAENEEEEEEKEEEVSRPPLEFVDATNMSFLRAINDADPKLKHKAGSLEKLDVNSFSDYVSKEEKAVFVDVINLYYQCPLTDEGITLVDTPGADSIHARHTEVAFDYMTHADAILYVTYYNHAFSKADREFLIQLGRVKEYFKQDKMFFIVNASDLSESEKELEGVVAHIEKNLLTCGIRNANIFPVSSHITVLSKLYADRKLSKEDIERYCQLTGQDEPLSGHLGLSFSGMKTFSDHFYDFILQRLTSIGAKQGLAELEKVKKTLAEWIKMYEENNEKRQQLLVEVKENEKRCLSIIEELNIKLELDHMNQEIEELVYYVKQRVFFRYGDEFKLIFNPLNFNKEQDMYTILLHCTNDVIRFVGKDLAAEMRATAFRIDVFVDKMVESVYDRYRRKLQNIVPSLAIRTMERNSIKRPTFIEGLFDVKGEWFKEDIKVYKSQVQFFSEGGQKKLRESIEMALRDPVHRYAHQAEAKLKQTYLETFREMKKSFQLDIKEQLDEYNEGKIRALTDENDVKSYQDSYDKLLE